MLFDKVSAMEAPVPEIVFGVIPLTAALLQLYDGVGLVLVLVILYVFRVLLQ